VRPGLALVGALTLLAPAVAGAHGPAPAVLEVLAADGAGPTWLRTSVGLVRRRTDGAWEHVCPALWDGNDRMLAAVAEDRPLVLGGNGYRAPVDRCEPWTDLGDVTAVAAGADEIRWVAGSRLVGGEEPVELPGAIGTPTSLVVDEGRVVVAGRSGLAVWGGDSWGVWPLADAVRYLRLVRGDDAFVSTSTDTGVRVDQVSLSSGAVVPGPEGATILGPVRRGAHSVLLADGRWMRRSEAEWVDEGEAPEPWTCLDDYRTDLGWQAVGCRLDGLYALGDGEPRMLFRFTQIAPSACAACDRDWVHYAGEAGWLGTEPATRPEGERRGPTAGGCSVAGGPAGLGWGAALALTLRCRRRRRPGR